MSTKKTILIISIGIYILHNLYLYKNYNKLKKQLKRNTWEYYD